MVKKAFLLLLISGRLFSAPLPAPSLDRIKQLEKDYVDQANRHKNAKITAGVALAALTAIGCIYYISRDDTQDLEGSIVDQNLSTKGNLSSHELTPKAETLDHSRAFEALDSESDDGRLGWFFKLFEYHLTNTIAFVFAGSCFTLGAELYQGSYTKISELLSKSDNVKLNGSLIFSTSKNLKLFIDNFVEDNSTDMDRDYHRQQIIFTHSLIIDLLENFIAALAAQASLAGNTSQEEWILNSGNRIFVGAKKLNCNLEDKLSLSYSHSEFSSSYALLSSLDKFLEAITSVASNCKVELG